MGALAQMLRKRGFEVRGSDRGAYPPMSTTLAAAGVKIYEGYRGENLDWGPDVVVVGNVVRPTYDEAVALRARQIPHCSLPQALAGLFKYFQDKIYADTPECAGSAAAQREACIESRQRFNAAGGYELLRPMLEGAQREAEFEGRLMRASYFFAGTFLFSAIMNYILARWIVTSPSGTQAFNEELGRMTLVSYPMIAIPSMLMMFGIFYYIWRQVRAMTSLETEQIFHTK